MLVIPMYQPYATATAIGLKRVETRPGKSHYRGLAAIHSCATFPVAYRKAYAALPEDIRARIGATLRFGQIIAVADLVDCHPTQPGFTSVFEQYPELDTPTERALGNYEPGRFGWVLENVRPLREPLSYKAHQGCYQLAADVEAEVLGRVL